MDETQPVLFIASAPGGIITASKRGGVPERRRTVERSLVQGNLRFLRRKEMKLDRGNYLEKKQQGPTEHQYSRPSECIYPHSDNPGVILLSQPLMIDKQVLALQRNHDIAHYSAVNL